MFSVITPMHNASETIKRSIESVQRQAGASYEHVLVDDGSTDGSAEIVASMSKKDDRIRIVRRENGGVSRARNLGMDIAEGKFVVFLDADDALENNALMAYAGALVDTDTPHFVLSGAKTVNCQGQEIGAIECPYGNGRVDVRSALKTLNPSSKSSLLHYVWNKCYSLKAVRNLGIRFVEGVELGEDFLFNCALLSASEDFAVISDSTYCYTKAGRGTLSTGFRKDELGRRRMMDSALLNLFEEKGLLPECKRRIDGLLGQIALASLESIASPDCDMSARQKTEYVRAFERSEYRDYVYAYLSQDGATGPSTIMARLFVGGHPVVFSAAASVRRLIKNK